ncbi:MAG: NRDE family protein [Aquabacterium sp.]|nr:NRDE family protein [Aquabacterium sp.]
MCLAVLALDASRRFPLVIAANRDEFFDRTAARLAWWRPDPAAPEMLGGRDLTAGGTWMGLTLQGRLALVTNVRDPARQDPQAPSRGELVPMWLRGDQPLDRFWPRIAMGGYNGFNLIAADFAAGTCHWMSNTQTMPCAVDRGIHGLSNALLDTPWPKVQRLKSRLGEALHACGSADELADELFDALADREPAPDADLPRTGVSLDWERVLSPAFIRTDDGRYGTRCSTLVITERINKRLVTHVLERSYTAQPGVALLRRLSLRNWPPRHTQSLGTVTASPDEASIAGPISEEAADEAPQRRPRARGVLKPLHAR